MTLRTYLILLFVGFSFVATAQNPYITDQEVAIVAQWEVGDTATYSYERSAESIDSLGKVTSYTRKGDIHIRVAKSSEKYYVMHWNFVNLELTEESKNERQQIILRIIKANKFIYRLSETGSFQELINWDDIQRSSNHYLDSLIRATKEKYQAQLYKAIKSSLQSQEAVTTFLAEDIMFFHQLHGIQLSRTDTLSDVSNFPNLFNPERPYPGIFKLFTHGVDEEKELGEFYFLQAADPIESGKILLAALEGIFKEKAPDYLKKELKNFKIEENNHHIIDLATGWPILAEGSRHTFVFRTNETNKVSIKRK